MTDKIARSYDTGTAYTEVTPIGAVCGAVNSFIVQGGMSDDRYNVRWSAVGDPTDWPTPGTTDASSKLSGQEKLPAKHGWVTGIAGGDFFGYIFQENAITKMTFVGGDVQFSFDIFEEGRGCVKPGHMVQVDDAVFFESDRGYHKVVDGVITDIGAGRTDRQELIVFEGNLPWEPLKTAAVNTARRLVFFPNQDYCYNYLTDQWTEVDFGLNSAPVDGNLVNTHKKNMIIGQSWNSGATGVVEVSSDGTVNPTCTFETGAIDLNEGGRVVVTGVRPIVIGGSTVAVRVGVQDDPDDSVSWTSSSTPQTRTGMAALRAEGRYIRVEVVLTGGFTTIKGVDVYFQPAGNV